MYKRLPGLDSLPFFHHFFVVLFDKLRSRDMKNVCAMELREQGLYAVARRVFYGVNMGCWKWFNKVLDEAGVEVTDANKERVDEVIHLYIGEQSQYGRCSADWRKARTEIQADEAMRQELIDKLQSLT
jgi:hypothetical protein